MEVLKSKSQFDFVFSTNHNEQEVIIMSFMKKSRIIASIMLIVAIAFFVFAITHPTASFPWSNAITYFIYAVYILIMVLLFAAPSKKKK